MSIRKAPKHRYYITYTMLEKAHACTPQLVLFAATFITAEVKCRWRLTTRQRNKRVYVTEKNVIKAEAAGLSFSWLLRRADQKHRTSVNSAYWKSNTRWWFDPALSAKVITRLLKRYGYL